MVYQPFELARDIAAGVGDAVVGGLRFLGNLLFPPAPASGGSQAPFTPPFTGGQCNTAYNITYDILSSDLANVILSNQVTQANGAVKGVSVRPLTPNPYTSSTVVFEFAPSNAPSTIGIINVFSSDNPARVVIKSVSRIDGLPDNCGNLGNPNPEIPVEPDFDDSIPIVLGAPIVVVPSFAAALAAALAAAKNALDVLAAVKSIADALAALKDLFDRLKEFLDDKEKDDDKKPTVKVYSYGSISRDGFLRLFPSQLPDGFVPLYVEFQASQIDRTLGRYLGRDSLSRYRYPDMGYIAFTSPSFGALSAQSIQFSRSAFLVPELASGFYYHLGLNGATTINAFLVYKESA